MKKILVVDDMSSWRDFNINAILEILGNNVAIDEADSAESAYSKILEHVSSPYDIVMTDLQMEDSHAGERLVEQIKSLPQYYRTRIIMISASYNIKNIAENLGVFYIRKSTAIKFLSVYEEVLNQ